LIVVENSEKNISFFFPSYFAFYWVFGNFNDFEGFNVLNVWGYDFHFTPISPVWIKLTSIKYLDRRIFTHISIFNPNLNRLIIDFKTRCQWPIISLIYRNLKTVCSLIWQNRHFALVDHWNCNYFKVKDFEFAPKVKRRNNVCF